MKEIFQGRRQSFLTRCLKYSRYVFNDHFVLVILVFLGFLSLQYRQLLENFPKEAWPIYLLLFVMTVLLFLAGNLATYLESADQIFLLAKEGQVLDLLKAAGGRQFLIWGFIQILGQVLFLPLYLKLSLPIWGFVLFLLLLTLGKFYLIQARVRAYQQDGMFQWGQAIADESKRKQSILQFFALFTTVKGVTSSVKRRSYLDFWLGVVPKRHSKTWDYLYLRAFLRSGDFLGLTIRLFGLSLLALLSIDLPWLATGLVLLLDYLLLFQLLALYHVYDYQYLSLLYPIDQRDKLKYFQRFMRGLLYGILGLQLICASFFLKEKIYLLLLTAGGLFLNQVYLGVKAKKLID